MHNACVVAHQRFYNRYEWETGLFDSGEMIGVSLPIPLVLGGLVGLRFEASLSLQLSGRIEIDVDGEGELKTKLEFRRYYEKGIAWAPGRGFYKIAPQPIKKSVFEVERLTIPNKVRVRLYPIIPQFTLTLGGFVYLLWGLVSGGVTVPIVMRMEPYFELQLDHTPESQCELSVQTFYGIDYDVYIREINFALEANFILFKKRWNWRIAGRIDMLDGAILPKTRISTGNLGCRRKIEYDWKVGSWSTCTSTVQMREVRCIDIYDPDEAEKAVFYCKSQRPLSEKPCIFDCFSVGCRNGDCMPDGKCHCDFGWELPRGHSAGGQCVRAVCRNTCFNGFCSGPDTCTCSDGWTGDNCGERSSAPASTCPAASQCLNGYGCADGDAAGCLCSKGWGHNMSTGVCSVQLVECSRRVTQPANCILCTSNETVCADCEPGFLLVNGVCTLPPPDVQKIFCDSSCETCIGAGIDRCSSCHDGDVFFGGRCLSSCPLGMVGIPETEKCAPCSSSCKQCAGTEPSACTACPDGLFLLAAQESAASAGKVDHKNDGTCEVECPKGMYENTATASCDECSGSCASCSGQSDTDCLSCANRTALHLGSCVALPCPEGSMLSPFNQTGNVCTLNHFNGPEPLCNVEKCPLHWRGDGECDEECNSPECDYDRSDCKIQPAEFCSTVVSCNSCQSYAGCGWCASTMACHSSTTTTATTSSTNSTGAARNAIAEPECPDGALLHHSCAGTAANYYEPQLVFADDLEDGSSARPVWQAGKGYLVNWTGGLDMGSVDMKFSVEGNALMDATIFNAEANQTLANTGVWYLTIPEIFPETCELQLFLTSVSDPGNFAYSNYIQVNQTLFLLDGTLDDDKSGAGTNLDRGTDAPATPGRQMLAAWSVSPWDQCSRICGGGIQEREVACVDVIGGAPRLFAFCLDGRNASVHTPSDHQSCNMHHCPVPPLRIAYPTFATVWHPSSPYNINVFSQEYKAVAVRVRQVLEQVTVEEDWQDLSCATAQTSTENGLLVADADLINKMVAMNETTDLQLEVTVQTDVGTETIVSEVFGLCADVDAEGRCLHTDMCTASSNPCANGGQCQSTPDSFVCYCQVGFGGATCGKHLDNANCTGGGIYKDAQGSCTCPADTACSSPDCTPVYEESVNQWVYYYPPTCKSCKCTTASPEDLKACSPNDCGGTAASSYCSKGKCECINGYRKKENRDWGCILDIKAEFDQIEHWHIGTAATIRWKAVSTSPISINLFRAGYGHFAVATAVPNSGVYQWDIPSYLIEGKYRLSIVSDYDWRTAVGSSITLSRRDGDGDPCCIVSPTASDTLREGALVRIVWTKGYTKPNSLSLIDVVFVPQYGDGNAITVAEAVEDTGDMVARIPPFNVFQVTDQRYVVGRFTIKYSKGSGDRHRMANENELTAGPLLMIDRPPPSIAITCCGTTNESFPVASGDLQELVWDTAGLVKGNCSTKPEHMQYIDVEPFLPSCNLTLYVMLGANIVARYNNVPNTGAYTFESPLQGFGRLEARIFVTGNPTIWSQVFLGNFTESPAVFFTSKSKAAGVAGSVVGSLLAVAVLIFAAFWFVKRQRNEEQHGVIGTGESLSLGSMELRPIRGRSASAPSRNYSDSSELDLDAEVGVVTNGAELVEKEEEEQEEEQVHAEQAEVTPPGAMHSIVKCKYVNAHNRKCKKAAGGKTLFCSEHCCLEDDCRESKSSSETFCSGHKNLHIREQMKDEDWYVGKMDKGTCKELVRSAWKGSFLVRDSVKSVGAYAICVNHGSEKVQEDLITMSPTSGKFGVNFCEGLGFDAVADFVAYWRDNKLAPQAKGDAFKLNTEKPPSYSDLYGSTAKYASGSDDGDDGGVAFYGHGGVADVLQKSRSRTDTLWIDPNATTIYQNQHIVAATTSGAAVHERSGTLRVIPASSLYQNEQPERAPATANGRGGISVNPIQPGYQNVPDYDALDHATGLASPESLVEDSSEDEGDFSTSAGNVGNRPLVVHGGIDKYWSQLKADRLVENIAGSSEVQLTTSNITRKPTVYSGFEDGSDSDISL